MADNTAYLADEEEEGVRTPGQHHSQPSSSNGNILSANKGQGDLRVPVAPSPSDLYTKPVTNGRGVTNMEARKELPQVTFCDEPDLKGNKEEDEKELMPIELTCKEKTMHVLLLVGRPLAIIACLYFFICSLNLLSSGFILIGGRMAGDAFGRNPLLSNPICGLMIGVTATAFLQSSSTSTSIVVTMVSSNILSVRMAIPIIMGSNIGTSVTGILVAVTQAGDRGQFEKAFSAATVHDMFNWLTVITLLPVEIATGYLYYLTSYMTDHAKESSSHRNQEFLSLLTKPFTNLIVQVDKKALERIAADEPGSANLTLLKYWCETKSVPANSTETALLGTVGEGLLNMFAVTPSAGPTPSPTKIIGIRECNYLFHGTSLTEPEVGGIVVLIALTILITCLILMVKVLKSLLQGPMAKVIKRTINADFPGKAAFLTGYVAILVGAIVTVLVQSSSVVASALTPLVALGVILVQSSSVVASALTPLVGLGMVTVERVFPMMLGANIGTTSTAMLAAFAASGSRFHTTLQIALCHLFFNLTGIIIWYPMPFMRKVPIRLAKFLGRTTAKYRWFAIMYIACMFFLIPLTIFGLSIPGWQVLAGVGIPVLVLAISVGIINLLQHYCPQRLPEVLRNWNFLPECMRSLAPLDRRVTQLIACCACCKCCKDLIREAEEEEEITKSSIANGSSPVVLDAPKAVVVHTNGNANSNLGFIADNDSDGDGKTPTAVWGSNVNPENYETRL